VKTIGSSDVLQFYYELHLKRFNIEHLIAPVGNTKTTENYQSK